LLDQATHEVARGPDGPACDEPGTARINQQTFSLPAVHATASVLFYFSNK